jgi:alanine dehydrogenase
MSMPVSFDAEAVERLLPMAECIDLMTDVQAAVSSGRVSMPLRSHLPLDEAGHGLLLMPGALPDPPVFGAKLVSVFADNPRRTGRPSVQGCVVLFDRANGALIASVDAASLTAIRTAAARGAASRALARPDASRLALLGYGVQAHSHLAAMRAVRTLTEVRIWGPDRDRAEAFAAGVRSAGLDARAAATSERAVRGADLICAVSAAREPVIHGEWLAPGCHLNLVGAHTPDAREADAATLARARVFTEITEFALAEAGDLLLAIAEGEFAAERIAGEIGAVFAGHVVGREQPDQITLYKSLGNTAQDLAAAHHVLGRWRAGNR